MKDGDIVVNVDKGIGRFIGIKKINEEGEKNE